MEMHAIEVTGTFAGHVLPGTLFVAWALFWIAEALLAPRAVGESPLERSAVLPLLKIVLPLVAVWFELPDSGWFPADAMMGWQHIAMYVGFSLSGIVDLLVRRGSLSPPAGYAAYAAALLNAGLLFWAHGGHDGVPGVAHTLLALLFVAAATFPLVELSRPGLGLEWVRRGTLLALGSWFIVIAWVLYRSEWDMADPVREGWTYVLFSWNAISVAILVTVVRIRTGLMIDQRTSN